MEFHGFKTLAEKSRAGKDRESLNRFYRNEISDEKIRQIFPNATNEAVQSCVLSGVNERLWYSLSRPYYNIWPAAIPLLTRINLDCTLRQLNLPQFSVLLRFPVGQELRSGSPSDPCW